MTCEPNELQTADRGAVYEFIERDNTVKNMVLVVSNQMRCEDNLCSILMLGTKYTGYDCVPITINEQNYYVHCGLVTYAKRSRLGKKIETLSAIKMRKIDLNIANNLGLEHLDRFYIETRRSPK